MFVLKSAILPIQFVYVKYRALGAYAHIAAHGLLDAAQTCSQSACHHILERNLARGIGLTGKACNSLHHGRGAANADHVETALMQNAVLGYKALFTSG